MELFLEYGYTSFNKFGEELCGDRVSIVKKDDYITLVLADGLREWGKSKYFIYINIKNFKYNGF